MGGTTAAQAGVTIDERIGMFDSQGTLREQAREVWNLVEPQVESVARAFWTRYAQSPDTWSPQTPWQDILSKHAEGHQTTLGAYHRAWH